MGALALLIGQTIDSFHVLLASWALDQAGWAGIFVQLYCVVEPVDKTIEDWKRRFRGMEPAQLKSAWHARAKDDVSWIKDSNYHAAVAERLKQIGHMAIDLDDDARKKLCCDADAILQRLENHLQQYPEKQAAVDKAIDESDAYFAKYGKRTARYYMYEQGVINELGDRLRAG